MASGGAGAGARARASRAVVGGGRRNGERGREGGEGRCCRVGTFALPKIKKTSTT
jgi:hypothetical protein